MNDQAAKFCLKCIEETARDARGSCRPCKSASVAAWRKANADRVRAGKAAWRKANPEKVKAHNARFYASNTEKVKANSTAWRAGNLERARAAEALRRKANPEKLKDYKDKWHRENLERTKANRVSWKEENREKVKSSHDRWSKSNPEKVKASNAAWRRANPEACRAANRKRRARKCKAGGTLSVGLTSKLFRLQKGMCPCCHEPLGADFHLDHIMPLALGGANEDWNIQLLRATCNQQKSAKDPIDFMQSRGFLL